MARSGKVGIDYFSHDVDIMQDNRIKIIKAKHGLLGYAVYLRLLEELYRDNGYYLQLSEDFNILFCDDNNLTIDVYILILNDCIEKGLFSQKLYKKHGIITSNRIQKNYCDAIQRRKDATFFKEYLLIKTAECLPEKIDVNIIGLNADIGTQRKGERKEKEKESISDFDKFWKDYPKKKAKADAQKAWNNTKNKPRIDSLLAILEKQKSTIDWTKDGGQFVPYAQKWINKRRWEDETQTSIGQPAPRQPELEDKFYG